MSDARLALPAVLLCACVIPTAEAAESYDACTGFITSLPVVVATQGVWCLNGDVATGVATGIAIDIQANNVTVDCNGFKVGGLAAGPATQTSGIVSYRLNSTIRGCNVRGFRTGVVAVGAGSVIEDNRLEANTLVGIVAEGDLVVRRNLVFDTGGSSAGTNSAVSIGAGADFVDNRIDGVVPGNGSGAIGIVVSGNQGVTIRNNIVKGVASGDGAAIPVYFSAGGHAVVSGNMLWDVVPASGVQAIECPPGSNILVRDVTHVGTLKADADCTYISGNWVGG